MYEFFKDMWYDFWSSVKELFVNPANWGLAVRFLFNIVIGIPLIIIIGAPYLIFMAIKSIFAVQESWD